MPYLEIEIKQLLPNKTDDFEVVFNPSTEDEFTEPVEFFALCVLRERYCLGEEHYGLHEYHDVILPVIFTDGALSAQLLSEYKTSGEQDVNLRKKDEERKEPA